MTVVHVQPGLHERPHLEAIDRALAIAIVVNRFVYERSAHASEDERRLAGTTSIDLADRWDELDADEQQAWLTAHRDCMCAEDLRTALVAVRAHRARQSAER